MLLLACMGSSELANAQLNPLSASFFQDQYLSNPAFVGMKENLKLNLHYRNQWSAIPGAPVNYALTAEYGIPGEKSALGVYAYVDKAGLLNRTRIVGSYAYHLSLNGVEEQLHFGVSVGIMSEKVDGSGINGDIGDATVGNFNNQPTYVDGDFGVAYTNLHLTAQLSIPNLNTFTNRAKINSVDLGTFYAAAAYKVFEDMEDYGYNLEPKLAYRGIKGYKDIVDIGLQGMMGLGGNQVNGMLVYHTAGSLTAGVGMVMKSRYEIQAMYNSQTAALSSYSNGTFEIGLGLKF